MVSVKRSVASCPPAEMAETELFAVDAYCREFDATVLEVDADQGRVALRRTAFYPGGGGQPHDLGRLVWGDGSAAVTRVKRDQGRIWHWLEGGHLPDPGAEVAGELDWERRHLTMRTHTALHILCGVIWADHRVAVTGGNMEPLSGRMDFEFETMSGELVGEIEKRVNEEVAADREIRVAILPRDEAFAIPDLIRTKINLLPEGITEVRTIEIVVSMLRTIFVAVPALRRVDPATTSGPTVGAMIRST